MSTPTEYSDALPTILSASRATQIRLLGIGGIIGLAALLVACGGSDTSSPASATNRQASNPPTTSASSTTPGPNPNAPEVVAPGDIPDNQVFVPYQAAGGFRIDVPEGWSRTEVAADHVTFSDKYNTIDLAWVPQPTAPTEASIKAALEAAAIPDFALGKVSTVQRKSGPTAVATYGATSEPNSVTGKRILLDVEKYTFWHNGAATTVTLSGAMGSDNVDPWKIVTDSLSWST